MNRIFLTLSNTSGPFPLEYVITTSITVLAYMGLHSWLCNLLEGTSEPFSFYYCPGRFWLVLSSASVSLFRSLIVTIITIVSFKCHPWAIFGLLEIFLSLLHSSFKEMLANDCIFFFPGNAPAKTIFLFCVKSPIQLHSLYGSISDFISFYSLFPHCYNSITDPRGFSRSLNWTELWFAFNLLSRVN